MARKVKQMSEGQLDSETENEFIEEVAQTLEELQAEESADLDNGWIEGKMMRKEINPTRLRVLILEKGKVVDDFYADMYTDLYGENGVNFSSIGALFSLKGDRITEKTLKEDSKFSRAKAVRFNVFTREMEIR